VRGRAAHTRAPGGRRDHRVCASAPQRETLVVRRYSIVMSRGAVSVRKPVRLGRMSRSEGSSVNDTMLVRTMEPSEFDATRALSISGFGGDLVIGRLLDDLHDSWAWDDDLSFVAERNGELVGYVLYTHAFLDAPSRVVDVLVLSPIAVRPSMQRRGIGGELITRTLTVIGQRSEPLVFLEGHPTYYPRFGFVPAAGQGFVAPSVRIPHDAFMVYPLPHHEPWMTGTLIYSDAFWRNDAVGLRA
jgi:putative acetyltransferase